MKSLVLGGTGFVGRRLVEILVAEGDTVTVLNRGVTPVDLPPGVARLVADRSEPASMQSALAASDWDAVFDVSGSSRSPAARIGESRPARRRIGRYATVSRIYARSPLTQACRLLRHRHLSADAPGRLG